MAAVPVSNQGEHDLVGQTNDLSLEDRQEHSQDDNRDVNNTLHEHFVPNGFINAEPSHEHEARFADGANGPVEQMELGAGQPYEHQQALENNDEESRPRYVQNAGFPVRFNTYHQLDPRTLALLRQQGHPHRHHVRAGAL